MKDALDLLLLYLTGVVVFTLIIGGTLAVAAILMGGAL